MSIRADILAAVRGQMPERVPWTIYPYMLPQGETERLLRAQGLGLACSLPPASPQIFQWGPNVEIAERMIVDRGQSLRRIYYRTQLGELTELRRSVYASGMAGMVSDWKLEFLVKKPSDYEILEFMVRDQVFHPNHEQVAQKQAEIGNDGVVICKVGKVPFQLLWMEYAGIERLILDLVDNPEPVESAMAAMIERDRQVWEAVAESPVELIHCSDNISADIVSPRIFDKYFLPYYEALTRVIPPTQKPLLIHIDGLVRSLASSIRRLPQGVVVEAFTPTPTGDFSVAEARVAWEGRPIWINYPSTVHLSAVDEIEAVTMGILQQAAPGNGFLLGITENMPATSWECSLEAIGRVIGRHGHCPIET